MISTGPVSADPDFDEGRHIYSLKGEIVPSVSEVMRPLTQSAYKAIDEETLRRAAAFGTAVHACTEFLDEGDLDESSLDSEWIPFLEAYKKWLNDSKPVIHGIERRFACSKFAGTVDRIVRIGNEDWIVDIKTTSAIHPHVGVQLAAYEALVRNHYSRSGRYRRAALQLRGDGTYRFKEFKHTSDYACFNALISLHNWMKQNVE